MSELADRTIAALRANHDDLTARVSSLDDADLSGPSGCSDWNVAAVLSHLGSGAEIGLATLTAARAGEGALGAESNQSVWGRWNAKTPAQQAADFPASSAALVAAFEGLSATERDELRVTLGFLPAPIDVATFAGMRLNEAALHGWDVRVAADARAGLTSEEAGLLLDHFGGSLSFLFGFLGKADALRGITGTLRVETTEPVREFGLVLGESVALDPSNGDRAALTAVEGVLTLPAEAFMRLVAGRLGPDHTPYTVELTGDLITLDGLRAVFPGY